METGETSTVATGCVDDNDVWNEDQGVLDSNLNLNSNLSEGAVEMGIWSGTQGSNPVQRGMSVMWFKLRDLAP